MRSKFCLLLLLLGFSVVFTYFIGYYKDLVLLRTTPLNSNYYQLMVDMDYVPTVRQSVMTTTTTRGNHNISRNSTSTADLLRDLEVCQQMRLNRFKKECGRIVHSMYTSPANSLRDSELNSISGLIDDEHKVFMRVFAKTGCTSWKTILFNNTKGVHLSRIPRDVHTGHAKYGLHKMKDEPSRGEQIQKMEDYFVMLNVRHPLERLESAYRDKFARPSVYRLAFLKRRRSRSASKKKNSPEAWENDDDEEKVSFEEFLDSVIQEDRHDMHWRPYLQLHVCNMHADYIAKTETSVNDMNYIIAHKLSDKGSYLASHSTGNLPTAKTTMALPLFSSLSEPEGYIDKLMQRYYQEDMTLFGYKYRVNEDTKEITGYCENVLNGLCC